MGDTIPHDELQTPEADGRHYEQKRQREVLYRNLANSIIVQLRDSGFKGHELLGFASEVMQAITDSAWGEPSDNGSGRLAPPAAAGSVTGERGIQSSSDTWLRGERTFLRPPTESDRAIVERWQQDPLTAKSLVLSVLHDVLRHLGKGETQLDRLNLLICDKDTQAPIGLVSLHQIDRRVRQAELGKMIGEAAFRSKGLAQETTQLIVMYGFNKLDLNRIYLRTLSGNLKNIKLNERLGFRFEGVLRQACSSNGQVADVVLMAMLREEFLADQQP